MGQVLGGIATHVTQRAVQTLGALFAEPVIRIAELEDAAAVGLDVLAAVVRPDRAGNDRRRAGGGRLGQDRVVPGQKPDNERPAGSRRKDT